MSTASAGSYTGHASVLRPPRRRRSTNEGAVLTPPLQSASGVTRLKHLEMARLIDCSAGAPCLRRASVLILALVLFACGNIAARAQGNDRGLDLASVSGTVLDQSAAPVAGSQVSLTLKDGARVQTLTSGTNGEFTFGQVPPGSYAIVIEAVGFVPFTSGELTITTADAVRLPPITPSIADVTESLVVKPTELIAAK